MKPKKEKEVSQLQERPLFQDTGRKLKFRAASELHDKDLVEENSLLIFRMIQMIQMRGLL